jgi:hypothetical protein
MRYTTDGRLWTHLCTDVERPLADAEVRLYRLDEGVDPARAVAARSKETFRLHGDGADRTGEPLATTRTDADGRFRATVDGDYDGEAFALDVRLSAAGEVEGRPVQATVTAVQPRWRTDETGAVATVEHALSRSQWCAVLRELGVGAVAGRVTDRETGDPLRGLVVTVADADLVQDDTLGSATTGADGDYLLYYPVGAYERVPSPFGPIELVGGPDLYFRVTSAAGETLLDEPSERGRDPGRENVGACHCEDLAVDLTPSPGDPPLFTHVGAFSVATDLDAGGTIRNAREGLGGPGWGFTGSVDLAGYVPEVDPETDAPLWYRFLYRAGGDEEPVVGSLIERATVAREFVGSDPRSPAVRSVQVAGAGATGGDDPGDPGDPRVVVPTAGEADPRANGWIPVVRTTGVGLLGDGYGPTLVRLNTAAIVAGGAPPSVPAGDEPTAAESGGAVTVAFETTVDDGSGRPSTDPADVERRGEATIYVNNWRAVRALAVVGDDGSPVGCDATDGATVRYTADHEFLRAHEVTLDSPAPGAGSVWPRSLAAGSVDRGATPPGTERGATGAVDLAAAYDGSGGHDAFADWPACSYVCRLVTRRALTNGRSNDDPDRTPVVDGLFYRS